MFTRIRNSAFALCILAAPSGSMAAMRQPMSVKCKLASDRALVLLAAADNAIIRRNFVAANTSLDASLDALGDAYVNEYSLDDTGMHLIVAADQQKHGKVETASTNKRVILVSRLEDCGVPALRLRPPLKSRAAPRVR